MKRIFFVILSGLMLWLASAPVQAYADDPLVIIRFNQGRVYYEQSLYQAVSRALQVKPGVVFDVLAVAPVSGDVDADGQFKAEAAQHGNEVMAALQRMKVPSNRLSLRARQSETVSSPEVHIFAR